MDASPITLVSLITNTSQRFIVPVYQRPYSWDDEQCQQLWEDVLSIGRRAEGKHFTGSVVWIQDGTMSAAGVNAVLLIDGQQRITTLTLLLVALADYAREHAASDRRSDSESELHFSCEEIVATGFLVSPFKKGEDHYRLTLSQGDRATMRSIVDHLENPEVSIVEGSHRLIENLNWFRNHLRNLADPNEIWDGIQRLEVVSISLAQGQDNPQLIFESMNSTGKDLSTSDLVRNYVLMGLPVERQNELYQNHWRKIEETLGADSYDQVFDEFLRDWLTVVTAPAPLVSRDLYRVFKTYVETNGYDKDDNVIDLLVEIRRFAGYYACIMQGAEEDAGLKHILDRMRALDVSVVNPLLMTMYEHHRQKAFPRGDFISMLRTVESYLLRRAVCDVPSNSLNKYFLSVIARLNDVFDSEDGNYREALEALLLSESGTARRIPDDREFKQALLTRDCYAFRRSNYLLAGLENGKHPKDPIDFSAGTYTIEHIMPQNALAHGEWKQMLGDDYQTVFDQNINRLGNLTLTAYNSELSDGSFAQKKERAIGGYRNEYLSLSSELHDASIWNEQAIASRTERLAREALSVWRMPALSNETITKYRPRKKAAAPRKSVTFRMLCADGLLQVEDRLEGQRSRYQVSANVTPGFRIRLTNGEEYDSPSRAAIRAVQLSGASVTSINGWIFWTTKGRQLSDIRDEYLASDAEGRVIQRTTLYSDFWDGFYSYCVDRNDFIAAFGDQSDRTVPKDSWTTFSIGHRGCHLSSLLGVRDDYLVAEFFFSDIEQYQIFLSHREEIESHLSSLRADLKWDEIDVDKKSRHMVVSRYADYKNGDWEDLYAWLADALLRMKQLVAFLD
ncbi:MAG: DUF4268 domain-containing protein [Bifidobacterium psychraerophilum]|uniref:DUF4268 domain-containing protein n=1 Tax=Bifidobacterium psychraerophilum TaxID=218140 RepID=UPI0039E80AC8